MKKLFLSLLLLPGLLLAQQSLNYQKPSQEILELVDVERAPIVSMDSKKQTLVYLYTSMYQSIEEVSEAELKIAGQRINPKINARSKQRYYTRIEIQKNRTGALQAVKGFPADLKLINLAWSPNDKYIACGNIVENGVELWVINIETLEAKKLTEGNLNLNLGNAFSWFPNSESLLVRTLPKGKKEYIDVLQAVPNGPSVLISDGTIAQNRTYPDLLKSKEDEENFRTLARSELYKVDLNGTKSFWKPAALYKGTSFSPNGEYVIITTIEEPFSYLVPWSSFPEKTVVYDKEGKLIQEIENRPASDNLPKGFMATHKYKRAVSWREDKPATLTYVIALDGGDPEKKADFRDELFALEAPFKPGTEKSLFRFVQRYSGIEWGKEDLAVAYDYWYNTRNIKTYIFNPSDPSVAPVVLFDRNYQDKYADPGDFQTTKNQYNREVLLLDGYTAYLIGEGFTPEGQFPFVDQINLKTKAKKTLYRSKYTDKLEAISAVLDVKKGELLVNIQAPSEYPNYYLRKIGSKTEPVKITQFKNPFEKLAGISKEVISYKRADGLELTATLYLPAGYDKTKKEKLPMVMWAYPQEFKDKNSAAQNTSNPNEFIYPYYGSPIYWVMKGYAILDDAAFPIVGEGDEEPNDTFIEQLVANAKAAIDAVDSLGYVDRKRVAVGGHSYGAFMTANLLTHSDLFAAGIARSGAYNRSLTPFGFQGEERNYWEAKEVYDKMSPFNYVDKMKTPMLLIHGADDNNPGTFPIQSERYFQALKGFGAPVRYIVLPKESHGYAAKESILHLLWEQDQWLEEHVKNRK
ncbi:MAG: S9 family peptidase [Flavobacteriia bacterium]|nr:S9 family peptidase [Flavobacteriia bacterium]OJX38532.1 MAG: S9 family peptidase [Flavobacteriia bacterium 40-80]